jgi:fatty acid desaturase
MATATLHTASSAGEGAREGLNESTFCLPKELVPELRALSRLRTWHTPAVIAANWAVIVSCFAVALAFPQPLVWMVAALVVATRQNALLVLMHEAVHGRLVPDRRWGVRLSNWFCAYPFLIATEAFARDHLAHHFHTNTADDPDLARKLRRPQEWVFPKTRKALVALLLRDFLGQGLFDFMKNAVIKLSSVKQVENVAHSRRGFPWAACLYYGLVLTGIAIGDLWLPVLLLWFVPYFTVVPVLVRIRAIAEHFGLPGENDLNSTRNTLCPLWEQLCIAPHGINYHLDHHLFPSVPYYNLPRLHHLLLEVPEYQTQACQAERYFGWTERSVLMQVTTSKAVVGCGDETPVQEER